MVAEDGVVLGDSRRFAREGDLLVADVDIEHLRLDRERTTSFGDSLHAFAGMTGGRWTSTCRRIRGSR